MDMCFVGLLSVVMLLKLCGGDCGGGFVCGIVASDGGGGASGAIGCHFMYFD